MEDYVADIGVIPLSQTSRPNHRLLDIDLVQFHFIYVIADVPLPVIGGDYLHQLNLSTSLRRLLPTDNETDVSTLALQLIRCFDSCFASCDTCGHLMKQSRSFQS